MAFRLKKNWLRHSPKRIYFFYSCIFIMIIGILSKMYWMDLYSAKDTWIVSQNLVLKEGEVYRLFTAIFIHADFGHFASNAALLSVLGYLLWGYFGFWMYPVFSLLGAAFVNLITLYFYEPDVKLLGASGLLYFTAGFWLCMYYFIERHLSFANRMWRIAAVTLVVFFPSQYEPNVSYLAHFVGLIVGAFFAYLYFIKNKIWIQSHERWQEIIEDPEEEDIHLNEEL